MISTVCCFGALVIMLAATPGAAIITESAAPSGLQSFRSSGLDFLKARKNALSKELSDFGRLRDYFDDVRNNDKGIVDRATRLLRSLATEDEESVRRVAVVASLMLNAGQRTIVRIAEEYRLPTNAKGWDFGPRNGPLHPGFAAIFPTDLSADPTGVILARNGSALADGVSGVKTFETALENGVYKIFIVQLPVNGSAIAQYAPLSHPFDGALSLSSADVDARGAEFATKTTNMTGGGDTKPAEAQGLHRWAVVSEGRLIIDFANLPRSAAIGAIIVELVNIADMEFHPDIEEALINALAGIEPATGGAPVVTPGFVSTASFTGFQTSGAVARKPSNAQQRRRQAGQTGFIAGRRGRGAGASTAPSALTAPSTLSAPLTLFANAPEAANSVPFDERQILVKRSIFDGPDTEGYVLDLGFLLDLGVAGDHFECLDCAAPDATGPDVALIESFAGDWLNDPEFLSENWSDLTTISINGASGSERAIVYGFDVNVDLWTNVELRTSVSDGVFIWLDGAFVFGATDSAGFVDTLDWKYEKALPDLAGGRHFLQVLLESHTETSGFALELRGVSVLASVPEPATGALLALGIIGLLDIRRRRGHNPPHATLKPA